MAKKDKFDLFGKKRDDWFWSYSPYGATKQSYSNLKPNKKLSTWGKIWRVGLVFLMIAAMLTLVFLSKKYGN